MSEDPNRKSYRQFQCRDYLWDTYEQMSRDLECSVDYLINEAMRHYARTQGKAAPAPAGPPQPAGRTMGGPSAPPPRVGPGAPMQPPPAMRAGPPPGMAQRGPTGYPQQPAPGQRMPSAAPQRPPAPMPAPVPAPAPMPVAQPQGAVLTAVFEGLRYPITKDEFFIGRSNKSCDLIVKDPNVSRQHARVVRYQGQYWMVDMGSTNGIEFQGGRVDRRPIAEGDLFRICDHEIVFTYR